MAPSVMNKLLQAPAILWKRGWLEEGTQGESYPILDKMEKIFLQALSTQAFAVIAVLGESILAALQEFNSKSSSSVGLTLGLGDTGGLHSQVVALCCSLASTKLCGLVQPGTLQ